MNEFRWRKSSYSGGGGNGECVEVALTCYAIGVRDTKDRIGGELAVPAAAWLAFADVVKEMRAE